MEKVVERERNKAYYRVLHVPIWVWVFFILPGNLTYALYLNGPDRRHALWLSVVMLVCAWRGLRGRLPGVEPRPYITHYGEDKPNLWYRVVCYTAAWVALIVPFSLNLIGLVIAALDGRWLMARLYAWLYYPLLAGVVLATLFDLTPRARRSTAYEGVEKGWFYVAVWTVVPAQVAAWAAWRLGGQLGLAAVPLGRLRLAVFLLVAGAFVYGGITERLPRTKRRHIPSLSRAAG